SVSQSISGSLFYFLLFTHPATTEIYPLSLHDALPISPVHGVSLLPRRGTVAPCRSWCRDKSCLHRHISALHEWSRRLLRVFQWRSEEHTSELQSRENLVCRLLLEKKK